MKINSFISILKHGAFNFRIVRFKHGDLNRKDTPTKQSSSTSRYEKLIGCARREFERKILIHFPSNLFQSCRLFTPLDKFAVLPSFWTFLLSKGQDFKSAS